MEASTVIKISPPEPHSVKQKLIMGAFLIPGLTEVVVCCGTKFGKTLGASVGESNGMISHQNSLWRWVAPIYEQTKFGYQYCKNILPNSPITTAREGSLELEIKSINSMIKFHHAQNPESLEGAACKGYVLDEAAKMKEDIDAACKTTRTMTKGCMVYISTPYGKNWFYRKAMAAREEMQRARFENRNPTKLFIRARTQDNPHVPRSSIEEARASLPARLFRQYYLAEFVDEGSVFVGYRECMDGLYMDMFGEHQDWFHDTAKDSTVVIGVDWAKMTDWTVFVAISIQNGINRVVGFERFHRRPYTECVRKLVIFSRKFKKVDIVYHDKTGVGEAIDDQMGYTELAYKGITFTANSKSEMVNKLMTTVEQKAIIMPRWNVLLSELETFEVKVSATGNMSYNAASGGHDDTVCALMLAHQAAIQYGDTSHEVRYLEDLAKEKTAEPTTIEQYYQQLADDEDDI